MSGPERLTVQDPLIRYATEIGWEFLSREDAVTRRGGETGTLLRQDLKDKLLALNPGVVTPESADQIITKLETARTNIEGNAEVLSWIREEQSVYVESLKATKQVSLIDFRTPSNNSFHVTDEWTVTNGKNRNRADVVFLINGIPVVIVEAKATGPDAMAESFKQVNRYHRETPEMLVLPQIFDGATVKELRYGVTWNLDRKAFFKWKLDEEDNLEKRVKAFFSRDHILDLLKDWIVFYTQDDELHKIVLRQHQSRAALKAVWRAQDPVKRRGLVWHTTGSGKTFTMIKAAQMLLRDPGVTVLMLVDRNELQSQLFGNLASYGLEPRVAKSKRDLRDILKSDYRGLVVSMIHKFDKADADLCERDNVAVLIDEAHRSTGGRLGNYLMGALPNATIVGFTGTPIDKTAYGEGTFKTFGVEDEKGYLDKYSIAESVSDGTTVKLHYALAESEIRVPTEILDEEFLNLAELEGVASFEDLNRILDKAVKLKAFLKADERVDQVARFVASHFKENVQPLGYKAFVVAVDRPACVAYKEALDKYLPSEWSEVVYSKAHNDGEELAKYHHSEDEEKRIRKAFRKPGRDPQILIVTEKLLTGFDAPILYCMYLDKPMRDHTLLQTIARVNRPYEDDTGVAKPAGLVVDFVGIFERLEDALAFDSDEVASVIEGIEVLQAEFERTMKEDVVDYLRLAKAMVDDKGVEAAVLALEEETKRLEFYQVFRKVQSLYEILSPDKKLRPYIKDFDLLAKLYRTIRSWYRESHFGESEFAAKTEELVKTYATTDGIKPPDEVVQLNEETLEFISSKYDNDKTKILNLTRLIKDKVDKEKVEQPHLIPLGIRAEAITERLRDRQIDTKEALRELQEIAERAARGSEEQAKMGLDPTTYGIFVALREEGVEEPEKLAHLLDADFQRYPNFRYNEKDARHLKAALYKTLLRRVDKDRMKDVADKLLELPRETGVAQ